MVRRKPDETKQLILAAATAEFAGRGLGGARVDAIAKRAGANKRMLYHYFGAKDDLYVAVLEDAYARIRGHEIELELTSLPPEQAIRELISATFDYFQQHPEFISLLNDANLYGGEHIHRSPRIREMHPPLVKRIEEVLLRGHKAGVFRANVDAVQLYVSIAALCYFYFSNTATLSAIFDRDLADAGAIRERQDHVTDVVMGYLRP